MLNRSTEKPILEAIYVEHGIPLDQLRRVPEILGEITRSFNRLTSRDFSAGELLRYMINRRKNKDWPRLGSGATRLEGAANVLSNTEIEHLRTVYLSMDLPSDEFLYRPAKTAEIEARFARASGIRIPGGVLVAVIIAKRKRGEWVRIRDEFGDIGDIVL